MQSKGKRKPATVFVGRWFFAFGIGWMIGWVEAVDLEDVGFLGENNFSISNSIGFTT